MRPWLMIWHWAQRQLARDRLTQLIINHLYNVLTPLHALLTVEQARRLPDPGNPILTIPIPPAVIQEMPSILS
jgi:hypothetical protein